MKVVHVVWKDPARAAGNGWMHREHFDRWVAAGLPSTDTVGLLVHENPEMIVVMQSIGASEIADGVKIARTAIVKMKKLCDLPITFE